MQETEEKLQVLLDHARNFIPYYKGLLPPPAEPLPSDLYNYLESFPLLSRQTVQTQKAHLYSSVGDTSSWMRIRTSGTSGEPVEIVLDSKARAVEAALFTLHTDSCLNSTDWRSGKVFHLTLHAGSTSQAFPALWHKDGQIIKWNLIRAWQQTDEQFIGALEDINDCVITLMPSVAELVCSRILTAGAANNIHPSLALLSGEIINAETRTLLKKAFGCPVSSLYTMAEVGIVGSESLDQKSYQVEEQAAIVEIVDQYGKRMPPGIEGEIVVTPLNNLAMPLIRYRTGDRGYWIDATGSPYVLRLVQARQPVYLVSHTGASVNVVRFAKILASLNVDRYQFDQEPDGIVIFSYSARNRTLDEMSCSLVRTIVRSALGPETNVQIRRVENLEAIEHRQTQKRLSQSPSTRTEPLGPDLKMVAAWLCQQLIAEPQIEAAVLTGSALEAEMTSRFSDIDLVVLVRGSPTASHWLDLARNLESYIPKLSTNTDCLGGLSQRTPIMACRLLCEQIPLIGKIDESNLPWPSVDDLRLQGLYWSQDTLATLWLRLVNSNKANNDPIREAWIATKFIVEALRYYYLVRDERETATTYILDKMKNDLNVPELWKSNLVEVIQVSREHKPPPLFGGDAVERYLRLALSCVRFVQHDLLSREYASEP